MLNVLCNDIKNSGRTDIERKEGRKNGRTEERKKSHVEVAAPPKKMFQEFHMTDVDIKFIDVNMIKFC